MTSGKCTKEQKDIFMRKNDQGLCSVWRARSSNLMLSNNYIETSGQKGRVLGVPGSLEPTCMVNLFIREAREGGGGLAVLRLDLTNE